jgi:LysR family transcriptional regulator, benzoate and cis,cis-muconate-responsive activator of ben and cat genes
LRDVRWREHASLLGADMNLEDVNAYLALAKHRHYGNAARHLHITQSTLSRRIQRLESALDVKLFDRSTREVELSDAGRALLGYWTDAHALFEKGREVMRSLKKGLVGELNVAFAASASLPPMVLLGARVVEKFEHIGIRTQLVREKDLRDLLVKKEVQLAFIPDLQLPDHFRRFFVQELKLRLILPERHPLNRKRRVRLKDLDGLEVVAGYRPYWISLWQKIDKRLGEQGVSLRVKKEETHTDKVLKTALRMKLPAIHVLEDDFVPMAGQVICDVDGLDISTQIFLAYDSGHTSLLMDRLVTVAAELWGPPV